MKKRCQIIDEAEPILAVSIHQNSYHQEEISGAQVFYYKNSEKGQRLAEILQKRFDYVLGEAENRRKAKGNDSYYLLLNVKAPIVIVECGFLSNAEEAKKLSVLSGILIGPYVLNWLDDSILSISSELRQMALIIILIKAGLSLNLSDLKKVGRPAVMMACVPASCEILAFFLLAPHILVLHSLGAKISAKAAVSFAEP